MAHRYITQEGHKLETGAPRPPATVTNAVSWRSEGIKYRKNEVFLDVIEAVNLLVSCLLSSFLTVVFSWMEVRGITLKTSRAVGALSVDARASSTTGETLLPLS